MISSLYTFIEPFRYVLYGLGLVWLYFFNSDVFRVIKYTAYKLGYQKGSGKGVIPGPLTDTRVLRSSDGTRIGPEFRQKYGPIYRTFCGDIPEIIISDPELVKIFYQGDGKMHDKTENLGFGEFMDKIVGHSMGGKVRDDWHHIRSLVDPHLSLEKSFDILPVLIADMDEWAGNLPRSALTTRDEKNSCIYVDARKLVVKPVFKISARCLFGDLVNDELMAKLYEMSSIHDRITIGTFFASKFLRYKFFKFLPIEANREIEKFSANWDNLLIKSSEECERRGISTMVSELYKESQAGQMSFKEYSHTMDEILFLNGDVAPIAVSWLACRLGLYPEIQARLAQEIKQYLSNEKYGATRVERKEAYIRMTDTYLHYCYLESARLSPLFCWTFSGTTQEPKIMNGYYVPPKSCVVIDGYSLNRTAEVWGNDGETFRPERFEKLSPTDYRYSFWRFGLGPRKCVFQNIADKVVKVTISALVESFDIDVKDKDVRQNPATFIYAPTGILILKPRDGRRI